MPRSPRFISPGAIYHLISRFVGPEWLIPTDEERLTYVRMLGHAFAKSDWRCLSYGIMSSHAHNAALAGEEPLGDLMRRAHSPFGEWINARRKRIGAALVRPYDYEVSPHRVAATIAYIHNNPVRAGVVPRARDSSWTSHRYYLGLAEPPPWLDVKLGLSLAGFTTAAAFDAWTDTMPDARPQLDPAQLERVRIANERAKASPASRMERGGAPALCSTPSGFISAASEALGVSELAIRVCGRDPQAVKARRIVLESGLVLGLTRQSLADELGVTPRAIRKTLARSTHSPDDAAATARLVVELRRRAG